MHIHIKNEIHVHNAIKSLTYMKQIGSNLPTSSYAITQRSEI